MSAALKLQEHTPMMQQYLSLLQEAKNRHKNCVLLFRLGDFYEIFFDEAKIVARVLGIQLTRRSKQEGQDIPMCGIPWHQLDSYLPQLIKAGYPVAIGEQTETPDEAKTRAKKQGLPTSKVLVERKISRIVTAGTLLEDNLLIPKQNNYLCSIAQLKQNFAIAWLDLSTGKFYVQPLKAADVATRLAAIAPSELLIADTLRDNPLLYEVWQKWKGILSVQPATVFHLETTEQRLLETFGVRTLDGFGVFDNAEISAAGALLNYAQLTQQHTIAGLNPPQQVIANEYLQLDAATRRSLELTHTQTGETKGSLLSVIDKTLTAAGSRLMAHQLAWPLAEQHKIQARLDAVQHWVKNTETQSKLRDILKNLPDMERALSRLAMNRGGPRDLAMVRDCLSCTEQIATLLGKQDKMPLALSELKLPTFLQVTQTLERALSEELPVYARDGNFVKEGYSPQLDALKQTINNSQKNLQILQEQYRQATSIHNLKIKNNNVLGYFVEVPLKVADELLHNDDFIHRQTLANCARFSTPKLIDLQAVLLRGQEQILALEIEIFNQLVAVVLADIVRLRETASRLAQLDVFTAWAYLSTVNKYSCPELYNDQRFCLSKGRHVVVEQSTKQSVENFIPNDCVLQQSDRLWLLTGPNMAGKSTFLRQNALMVVMAHMGGFVPAKKLEIGVVDKLFSRVGAADDLAQGRSTFMVEMVETAAILNQATPKSFVILDEIGRGTSTYDGLSIAWAVLEYLHNQSACRGLFATHYHELTELTKDLDALTCHTMDIAERDHEVIFLHQVIPGVAGRSYGVFVAQLAGMPRQVLARANNVLRGLEAKGKKTTVPDVLPLFEQPAAEVSPVLKTLQTLDIDSLSPRDALQILYDLKTASE